jgi:3-isopropylmalate dehydrogenase
MSRRLFEFDVRVSGLSRRWSARRAYLTAYRLPIAIFVFAQSRSASGFALPHLQALRSAGLGSDIAKIACAGLLQRCNGIRGGVSLARFGRRRVKIGIMLGDDIGREVVPECVKVMQAAARRTGLGIDWQTLPLGKRGHEEHGKTLPEITEKALWSLDGWIMGPIGHAAYPRNDPTWVMPPVRKKYELFAAIRPSRSYPNIHSIHKDVDIAFVRELSEGMLYSETVVAGAAEFRPNDEFTIATRMITRKGSNRVAREAFEIARTRKRKKVTAAHKEPVYRLACGMFAEECRKVAAEYPDVLFEEAMIDTISMKLVMNPQQYDVVVTSNQFGDILTDIGAGLVGGLGLAPGLCVGARQAMAQATHGSAPDIAGKGIANPYAMIASGQMLMGWLGRKHNESNAVAAADYMQTAIDTVISEGKHLTADLGGKASTKEMGDAIAAAVLQ